MLTFRTPGAAPEIGGGKSWREICAAGAAKLTENKGMEAKMANYQIVGIILALILTEAER